MVLRMPYGREPVIFLPSSHLTITCSEAMSDVPNDILPAHRYVRSVHNIQIERSWLRLRLTFGDNACLTFEKGKADGIFDEDNPNHLWVLHSSFTVISTFQTTWIQWSGSMVVVYISSQTTLWVHGYYQCYTDAQGQKQGGAFRWLTKQHVPHAGEMGSIYNHSLTRT